VGVQVPPGCHVLQAYDVPVAQNLQLVLGQTLLVVRLDQPLVVLVLVGVRGDLLLPGAHFLGIQVLMRMQVAPTRLVILDGHHRSVGHVPGLAGIIQRIADQPGLKGRAIEAIAIATAIEDTQMDVEEQDVEQDGPDDQGDGPAGHLLYGLHDGLSQIAKDEPQFGGRVQTHQQHHKQTHKLNAYRAG